MDVQKIKLKEHYLISKDEKSMDSFKYRIKIYIYDQIPDSRIHIYTSVLLMSKDQNIYSIKNIEFQVIYSHRRTLGISVLPDSSVIVRVPYRTSYKTISRIVEQKADWIIKHTTRYRNREQGEVKTLYGNGEPHLFRGKESVLRIEKSTKHYIRFKDNSIELGLTSSDDPVAIKKLLYKGYKNEAMSVLPEIFSGVLQKHEAQKFKPTGLVIRTMKRRWGSCSGKGLITLSTELIKLSDVYIEYVILHELCHLKHHNHGVRYYKLLSELSPDWKTIRKNLRSYITQ